MIDVLFNTYTNHRSVQHYNKTLNNHKNLSKSEFSKQTGYSTQYYHALLLNNVTNIHVTATVESGHDKKNCSKQLDTTVKKHHLKSDHDHVCMQLHFISNTLLI